MKDKFQKSLDDYYDKKISIEDLIYNIKLLHREKFRIDTEDLKLELHPKLQEILPELIKRVEKKTNFVYFGIYDSLAVDNTELKHYEVRFQHVYYFGMSIDICVGQIISMGSGENETFRYNDDNKLHIGVNTDSFGAVWGEFNINDKNLLNEILKSIIKFHEDYTY